MSRTYQKVELCGRAGGDAKHGFTREGVAMAKVGMAIDASQRGQRPFWIEIVATGEIAAWAITNIRKGALFVAEGELFDTEWTPKGRPQDTHRVVKLHATALRLAGSLSGYTGSEQRTLPLERDDDEPVERARKAGL